VTPAPHLDDDARALVTEDRGEQPLGVGARQREFVGVTDAGGLDLDQNFAGFGTFELDVLDDERLSCFVRHGCASLHAREATAKRRAVPAARACSRRHACAGQRRPDGPNISDCVSRRRWMGKRPALAGVLVSAIAASCATPMYAGPRRPDAEAGGDSAPRRSHRRYRSGDGGSGKPLRCAARRARGAGRTRILLRCAGGAQHGQTCASASTRHRGTPISCARARADLASVPRSSTRRRARACPRVPSIRRSGTVPRVRISSSARPADPAASGRDRRRPRPLARRR